MVVEKGNSVDNARQQERLKTNDNYALLQKKKMKKERYKRRRKLMADRRYGKGGRHDRLADALGEIPILGDTALAPMRGFLKGSVKAYEAQKEGDVEGMKEVAKDVVKAVKDMKK